MPGDPFVDDEVALRRIREVCRAFAGADEAALQDRPLFRVDRRRFAIFNGAASRHDGDRGWLAVRLDDPDEADWHEIAELLESAYRVVAPRRPI